MQMNEQKMKMTAHPHSTHQQETMTQSLPLLRAMPISPPLSGRLRLTSTHKPTCTRNIRMQNRTDGSRMSCFRDTLHRTIFYNNRSRSQPLLGQNQTRSPDRTNMQLLLSPRGDTSRVVSLPRVGDAELVIIQQVRGDEEKIHQTPHRQDKEGDADILKTPLHPVDDSNKQEAIIIL